MLSTYDFGNFSIKVKKIRKTLGFTILDVSSSTGINQSTIKQLEAGKVIPRFDTIKILSSFYKYDLFSIFKESLYDSMTMLLFNSLSTFAATNDIVEQEGLLITISNHLDKPDLKTIEFRDLQQHRLFVEGLLLASRCNYSNSAEIELALEKYSEALSISIPSFSFENFQAYKYFSIEFNILFSAAVLLGIKRECLLSNNIFMYVLEHYKLMDNSSKTNCLLISKLYYNLAYNYHRLDKHSHALEYSMIGIKYCVQNDTHQYLPLLLGRKGVAMHNLRNDNWCEAIMSAITLLKIQGSEELLPSFEELRKRLVESYVNSESEQS